jgi:hypothetical protein
MLLPDRSKQVSSNRRAQECTEMYAPHTRAEPLPLAAGNNLSRAHLNAGQFA